MYVDEYDGRAEVSSRGNNLTRASIDVNEYGNGAFSSWDKNGYCLK